ncbi:MAG: hypothetical protein ABR549_10685 [Mycobacteriales bacterium]
MSLILDPQTAEAVAPMAGFVPPPVGDVAARRRTWEPISAPPERHGRSRRTS